MNLKLRFSLFAGFLVIASGLAVWGASRQLAEEIIGAWAARYAERQVLYDKARTLQPLMREIALARQLASSPQIKDWARRPEEAEARRRGLAELESFRGNFAEHNYFLGLAANGAYYHNNGANEYAGRELRYTLAPKKASDRWFFDVIQQGRDLHINVNPDAELGVTKLWIDILVRDGNDILGVAGTGLDLTPFLREVVDNGQPGISNLFVDHDGAIQLFRDQGLIDFASITKGDGEHRTLDLLFDRPDDRQALRAAMKEVEAPGTSVISRIVHRGDKRYIAGIAYLPELGWYDVTLMDLEVILPVSTFRGIFLVYGVTLLFAIFLFNWVLGRLVLRPLKHLEKAVVAVRDGRFVPDALTPGGQDEMGSLLRHFKSMAEDVERSRQELEAKVMERTEALERLTQTDMLTDLLNRRGMRERLLAEVARAEREERHFGVLWLDVDHFKQINDRFGHASGDLALGVVADLIRRGIRPYDSAARWGGDEFLVLIQDCDEDLLASLGERIRGAVASYRLHTERGEVSLSVSIGGHLASPGEAMETILLHADRALYAAKAAGRNCLRLNHPA